MKTYFECVPCLIRQAHEAASFATDDAILHEQILRRAMALLAELPFDRPPPYMAAMIHREIKAITGTTDLYLEIKKHSNQKALEASEIIRENITESQNPFNTAAKLAIAGNSIDYGAPGDPGSLSMEGLISEAEKASPCSDTLKLMADRINDAKTLLYLGDNCGEIIFDRLFLEQINVPNRIYAVRGHPIINDVTVDDAYAAGIDSVATILSNGSDAPGSVLEECSDEFMEVFKKADIIISKGQGNYETLSSKTDYPIFFMLKAKCPLVAGQLQCSIGDYIIKNNLK